MEPPSPQTPRTAGLIAADREFLWHPFTPMKPWCENKDILVIERGEREFLIDTQGRRYIDGVSSLWCNIHGHCVPELDTAVRDQLAKVAHTSLLGLTNIPAVQLAQRLVQLARANGLALDKVFYSDNGSTAVEVACKMAYQYWTQTHGLHPMSARSRFIALESSYHGDTLGAVSVGGIPLFHHAFKALCFPVDFAPAPNWSDEGDASLAHIDSLLQKNPHAHAAIVIEPLIQGAGGMLVHPPGFLAALRALADKHDTLLIADEVLTGFGRTGRMFACQHENVTPDLLCLSKGLTAGYMPLGATLATKKIFDAFYVDPALEGNLGKTFFHGHTFTGHPLACAVALASLDLFEKNNLLDHVATLQPILESLLEKAAKIPFVSATRQCGLMGAIDLAHPATGPFPPHWRVAGDLCTRLRSRGVLLRPLAETLVIMPPLAITRENMEQLCAAVLEALTWIPEIVTAKNSP